VTRARRRVRTRQRRRVPVAALALLAIFVVKLAAALQFQNYPLLQSDSGPDAIVYAGLARQVTAGNPSLAPGLYFYPPLYVYFLALVLAVANSFVWVRIAQIALGTVAVALIFRTADLWHGRRAAWLAGGLATLTGVLTFYEVLLLPSALDPFLTALALYLFAEAVIGSEDPGRAKRGLLAGIAFGLLGLNHPQALLAVMGLTLLALVARRRRTALVFTAGAIIALTPMLVRNYFVASDLSPISSHGGVSFYIGNNPAADGTHRAVEGIAPSVLGHRDDARRVAERAIGRPLDDSEVSAHFYGQGWTWILSRPAAAARLFAHKLAYAFNAAEATASYSYTYYRRDEHNLLRYLPAGAWLLVPLGVLGVWLGRPMDSHRRRAYYVWAAFIPLFAVAVAAYFVSSRQRLPLLIPLCIASAAALDRLMAGLTFRRRTTFEAVGYVAVAWLTILAVFANWPLRLEDGRSEERTRVALWLIGQERYDEAEARVSSIEKEHPDPGMLQFRIGRGMLARNQPDAAVRHLERARALGTNQSEIDLTYGQALLLLKRPRDAIPYLRRAFEAKLLPHISGFDLARAHAASGDRASALRVLQTLRPERPDDGEAWRRLGQLALDLDAPRLSEAFLRQALRVEPGSADGHEQLGLAMARAGRFEEAVGAFQEAARIAPRDASVRLNLAVGLAEIGRVDDARREAQEALRIDPSYDKARQFLKQLLTPKTTPNS
jgi:tetratricopeptide (TPR) repeat protein